MDKKAAFRQLAEDVSRCHLCEQLKMPPHDIGGEFLENDHHGLDTDLPYVNLWNLWHYNLDADIMIIGQDYGQREESAKPGLADPTEQALRDLISDAFSPDVSVFFTNAANCYRHNKTTGSIHPGWLPLCANRFLGRLIAIVQPKAIVALGYNAFTALSCLNEIPLVCHNPKNKSKDTLADYMRCSYSLTINNKTIAVYPVYHPGVLGQRNRSLPQQKEDWRHIAEQINLL